MNSPTNEMVLKVLSQMKEQDKSYSDFWEEYYSGTSTTYSFSKEKNCYILTMIDIIAASFFEEREISEKELGERLRDFDIADLRKSGFDV